MVAEDRSIEHAHRHPPSHIYLKNQMPHLNTGWDSFLFGKVKGFQFIKTKFKNLNYIMTLSNVSYCLTIQPISVSGDTNIYFCNIRTAISCSSEASKIRDSYLQRYSQSRWSHGSRLFFASIPFLPVPSFRVCSCTSLPPDAKSQNLSCEIPVPGPFQP